MSARDDVSSGSTSNHDDTATGLLPSRWVVAALAGQGFPVPSKASADSAVPEPSSSGTKKWAGMRLVDTVMFSSAGEVESWVFTSKAGHVTTKKRAQAGAKIAERFEHFALANPRNSEQYVALLAGSDQPDERIVLDKIALRELLPERSSQDISEKLPGATLQCYLRPQNGSNSYLRGCYHHRGRDPPSYSLTRLSPLYRLRHSVSGSAPTGGDETPCSESPILDNKPESKRLRSEAETALSSIVAFLEPGLASVGNQGQARNIQTCKADFVIDDNGELWLTSIPSVTVPGAYDGLEVGPSNAVSAQSTPKDERKAVDARSSSLDVALSGSSMHMPPLLGPTTTALQVAAPLDGSGRTPLGSARQEPTSARSGPLAIASHITAGDSPQQQQNSPKGGGLPAIQSTMLGARSTPGDHNSRLGGKQRQGEEARFIEKREGVYVANVHASALRGLCCWKEVSRQGVAWFLPSGGRSNVPRVDVERSPHSLQTCSHVN